MGDVQIVHAQDFGDLDGHVLEADVTITTIDTIS